MKKCLLFALAGAMALGAFNSCKKDDKVTGMTLIEGSVNQQVWADENTGASQVTFETTGTWTSSIAGPNSTTRTRDVAPLTWIRITPTGGRTGNDTITILLDTNYSGADRTAVITITCGGDKIEITVTQKSTTEAGEVPVPEIDDLLSAAYMPDANFITYCKNQLFWDTNGDSKLSSSEAAKVTRMDVGSVNYNISSLEGIEYFTGLTYLDCQGNQLTALDVSNNPALTELYCYSNKLTALDVSNNPALTVLWCYNNKFTALDVSNNPALTVLWCNHNQLTGLDVSNNTALTNLSYGLDQLVLRKQSTHRVECVE